MKNELVIVLDFGGQYNQLVARRVRECNVYCEIYSYKTDIEKIKAMNPKGIIQQIVDGETLSKIFEEVLSIKTSVFPYSLTSAFFTSPPRTCIISCAP